jgi:signal transduction histidine kinase
MEKHVDREHPSKIQRASHVRLVPAITISKRAEQAHAMKNCLTIISAVASLVESELSAANRERMDRLQDAVQRAVALLKEDLSEDASAAAERRKEIDVEALLVTVCQALCDRAAAANVQIVVDCRGGFLMGDGAKLHQALFNVIANAVEATPSGCVVHVRTRIKANGDQKWTIQDAGPGMPTEVIRQLGVPHRSTRRGGSGLGIALAASVARDHGGVLVFKLRPGQGTTVTMLLPSGSGVDRAQKRGERRRRGQTTFPRADIVVVGIS